MKIAFVTACLDPGCDGVGDYTHMLAQQCRSVGHNCILISLADAPVERSRHYNSNDSDRLRLSTVLPWESRIERARRCLDRFDPDWVSLQFVSYGYDANGLAAGLDQYFSELVGERALHVMLHELWIGHHRQAKMKDRFLGTLQRFFILRMLRRLNPGSITTSIPLYARLLRQAGFHADVLPLFGNISIAPDFNSTWFFHELRRNGIDIHDSNRSDFWLIGMFGSLHPNWPPEPVLTLLRNNAMRYGRKIVISSIGRLGPGRQLWKRLAETQSQDFGFVDLGEQDSRRISQFLQAIDFGIAGSPLPVIGKSGTAAAMVEHGVPVIVNWNDEQLSCDRSEPWYTLNAGIDLMGLKRRLPNFRLPETADKLMTILQNKSQLVTA